MKSRHTVFIPAGKSDDDSEDNEKQDTEFNTMPRIKQHDDTHVCVLPYSACFVFKKISDFDPETSSFKVALTTIIRIKFTGIENMEEVMEYCSKNLKCRIHDEEMNLLSSHNNQ